MNDTIHPANFQLVAPFEPAGDQPQAIAKLIDGFESGLAKQTLLGVTGSGKRSEEHTSELQSLMRISYAVFCLKKKTKKHPVNRNHETNNHKYTQQLTKSYDKIR